MEIKKADKPREWTLYKNVPTYFQQKTVSVADFQASLGRRLNMPKKDSFQVIKELKILKIADYQKNKGRILFRL